MRQAKQKLLNYGIPSYMVDHALEPQKARREAAMAAARSKAGSTPQKSMTSEASESRLPRMRKQYQASVSNNPKGIRKKVPKSVRKKFMASRSSRPGGLRRSQPSPSRQRPHTTQSTPRASANADSDSDDAVLSKRESVDSLGMMETRRSHMSSSIIIGGDSFIGKESTLANSVARKFDDLDERVRAQTAHRQRVQQEQELLRTRTARLQEEADLAMERYRESARAVDTAIEREHGALGINIGAAASKSSVQGTFGSSMYVRDHGVGRGIVGSSIVPVDSASDGAHGNEEGPRSSTLTGAADDKKRHAIARAQLETSRKEVLGLLAEHRGRAAAQRSALEATVRNLASHREADDAISAKGSTATSVDALASSSAVARFDARRKQLDELVQESKASKEDAAKQLRSLFGECVDALFELEAMASEGRRGLALREELQRVRDTMKASAGMVDRLSARARDLGSKLTQCKQLLSKQVHSTETVQVELHQAEEANAELRRALASADARAGRVEKQLLDQNNMISRAEWNDQVQRALQSHERAEKAEAEAAMLKDRLRRISDAQQAHADARASGRIMQLSSQIEGLQERLKAQRDEFASQLKERDDEARKVEDSLQSFLEARLPSRERVTELLDEYRSRRASLEQILRATGLSLSKDPKDGESFAGFGAARGTSSSRRSSVHDVVHRVTERMMEKARRRSVVAASSSSFGFGRAASSHDLFENAAEAEQHPKGWTVDCPESTTASVAVLGATASNEQVNHQGEGATFLTGVPSAPQLLNPAPSAESLVSQDSSRSASGVRPSSRVVGTRLARSRPVSGSRKKGKAKSPRGSKHRSQSPRSDRKARKGSFSTMDREGQGSSMSSIPAADGLASMPELPTIGGIEAPEVVVRGLQHQLGKAMDSIQHLEARLAEEQAKASSAIAAAREEADKEVAFERMQLDNTFGRFARHVRKMAEGQALELERAITSDSASDAGGAGVHEDESAAKSGKGSPDSSAIGIDAASDGSSVDPSSEDKQAAQRAAAHRALEKLVGVESTAIARVAHLSQQLSQTEQQLCEERERRAAINARLLEAESKQQALDWFNSDTGPTESGDGNADADSRGVLTTARRWQRQLEAASRRGQFKEEARRVAVQVRARTAIGSRVKSAVRRVARQYERKTELAMLLAASAESDAAKAIAASVGTDTYRAQSALARTFVGSRSGNRNSMQGREVASARPRQRGEDWSPPGSKSTGRTAGDELGSNTSNVQVPVQTDGVHVTAVEERDNFLDPDSPTGALGTAAVATPQERPDPSTTSHEDWTPTFKGGATSLGIVDAGARKSGASAPLAQSSIKSPAQKPPRARTHSDRDSAVGDAISYAPPPSRPDTRRSSRGSRGIFRESAEIVDGPAFGRIPEVPQGPAGGSPGSSSGASSSLSRAVSRGTRALSLQVSTALAAAHVAQGSALSLSVAKPDEQGNLAQPWSRGTGLDHTQQSVVFGEPRDILAEIDETSKHSEFQGGQASADEVAARRLRAAERLANRRSLLSSSSSIRAPGALLRNSSHGTRPMVRDVGVNTRYAPEREASQHEAARIGRSMAADMLLDALQRGSSGVIELAKAVILQLPDDLAQRQLVLLDRIANAVLMPPPTYGGAELASRGVHDGGGVVINEDLEQVESVLDRRLSTAIRSAAARQPSPFGTRQTPNLRGRGSSGLPSVQFERPDTAAAVSVGTVVGDRIGLPARPQTTAQVRHGSSTRQSDLAKSTAGRLVEESAQPPRGASSRQGGIAAVDASSSEYFPRPPTVPQPRGSLRLKPGPQRQRRLKMAHLSQAELLLDPRAKERLAAADAGGTVPQESSTATNRSKSTTSGSRKVFDASKPSEVLLELRGSSARQGIRQSDSLRALSKVARGSQQDQMLSQQPPSSPMRASLVSENEPASGVLAVTLAAKQNAADSAIQSLHVANRELVVELRAMQAQQQSIAAEYRRVRVEKEMLQDRCALLLEQLEAGRTPGAPANAAPLEPSSFRIKGSPSRSLRRGSQHANSRSPVRGRALSPSTTTARRTDGSAAGHPSPSRRRTRLSPSRQREGARPSSTLSDRARAAGYQAAVLGKPPYDGPEDAASAPIVVRPFVDPNSASITTTAPVLGLLGEQAPLGSLQHSRLIRQVGRLLRRRSNASRSRAQANWGNLSVLLKARRALTLLHDGNGQSDDSTTVVAQQWVESKTRSRRDRIRARSLIAGNAAEAMEREVRHVLAASDGRSTSHRPASTQSGLSGKEQQPSMQAMVEAALPMVQRAFQSGMSEKDQAGALMEFVSLVAGKPL